MVRRLAAALLGMVMVLAIGVAAPAGADTLALNGTAVADCPDCATATGGSQVVNYVMDLAPQTVSLDPTDGSAPPAEGWQASADAMVHDESQLAAATSADAADGVAGATASTELGAGAVASLCSAGFLCPAGLAVGAFTTGYVIGTGAKALYMDLFGGTDNNIDSGIGAEHWVRYTGTTDYYPASSTGGSVIHPGEYYMVYEQYSQQWSYSWTGSITDHECRFGPFPPSETLVRSGTTTARCSSNPPQPMSVYVRTPGMFSSHTRPVAPASGVDTTGATTVPAPAAPSRSSFDDAVTNVLNDPNNHDFRLWLEHELSPRCHADPTSARVNVPEIGDQESLSSFEGCLQSLGLNTTDIVVGATDLDQDYGAPVLSDPGNDAQADPGSTVTVYVNPSSSNSKTKTDERCRPADSTAPNDPGVAPPGFTGTDPRFAFRPDPAPEGYAGYDWTQSPPAATTVWLHWGSETWGYRHISIRRGYGPQDEQDTADALQDPAPIHEGGPSYMFYKYYTVLDPATGTDLSCARGVLVNFFKRDIEPRPRDIITSFYGIEVG